MTFTPSFTSLRTPNGTTFMIMKETGQYYLKHDDVVPGILESVRCNLIAPVDPPTRKNGFTCALSLVDDYSGNCISVCFMRERCHIVEIIKILISEYGPILQRIITDYDNDFRSEGFKSLLVRHNIKHVFSRQNHLRPLFDMAKIIMVHDKMQNNQWKQAVIRAIIIKNKIKDRRTGKSPHDIFWEGFN